MACEVSVTRLAILLLFYLAQLYDLNWGLKLGQNGQPHKIRHMRGKYTVKEEVVKRVENNHPCRLTRTAVKVTFPSMKSEVLVSFIGYKEPRLMFVNRCKGLCSSEALGRVACVATKRKWKKVNMQLKTQVLGRTETKEKFKELVLEEHEECACQCLTISPSHCLRPELFNNETCACACDQSIYRRDKIQCEAFGERVWDELTCSCRRSEELSLPDIGIPSGSLSSDNQKLSPGAADTQNNILLYDPAVSPTNCHDCYHCFSSNTWLASSDVITRHSWTWFAVCVITILLLCFSTIFYWKKTKALREELNDIEDEKEEEQNMNTNLDGGSAQNSQLEHSCKLRLNGGTVGNGNTGGSLNNRAEKEVRGDKSSSAKGGPKLASGGDNRSERDSKVQKSTRKKRKKQRESADIRLNEMIDLHKPAFVFEFGDELDPNFVNHSLVQPNLDQR